MQIRYWALIIGVIYLLVGIVGFVPAFYTKPPAGVPHVDVTTGYGYLLGLFPINVLHNIVHVLIGLLGIVSYFRLRTARAFSRFLFLAYGTLTFIGFIPTLDTLGGLVPIFGNDVWLHAGTAVVSAYFGWVVDEETNAAPFVAHAH